MKFKPNFKSAAPVTALSAEPDLNNLNHIPSQGSTDTTSDPQETKEVEETVFFGSTGANVSTNGDPDESQIVDTDDENADHTRRTHNTAHRKGSQAKAKSKLSEDGEHLSTSPDSINAVDENAVQQSSTATRTSKRKGSRLSVENYAEGDDDSDFIDDKEIDENESNEDILFYRNRRKGNPSKRSKTASAKQVQSQSQSKPRGKHAVKSAAFEVALLKAAQGEALHN